MKEIIQHKMPPYPEGFLNHLTADGAYNTPIYLQRALSVFCCFCHRLAI